MVSLDFEAAEAKDMPRMLGDVPNEKCDGIFLTMTSMTCIGVGAAGWSYVAPA